MIGAPTIALLTVWALAPLGVEQRTIDRARDALMSGQYVHARHLLEPVLEHEVNNPEIPHILIQSYIETGQYRQAQKDFNTFIAAHDLTADDHMLYSRLLQETGQYTQAIQHAKTAIELDSAHIPARYELGHLYEMVGRYEEAIETYRWFDDLLTRNFPETARDAHYAGLGFLRFSVLSQHPNLARRTQYVLRELLQKSCEIMDLTYWPARLAIADLLREKYNLEEAHEDYIAVLQQNPHSTKAHLGLGKIALEGWQFEQVELRVRACLDVNPDDADAYVLLAHNRMLERRFAEAEQAALRALDVNPNHQEALGLLASAQVRLGRPQDMEGTLERAYKVNARPAVFHTIMGQQYSAARQFEEAETHLTKAIEQDPTASLPRNELGMMYMQWGFEQRAREALNAAFQIDAYNDATKNTLDLLDRLQAFEHHTSEHFEIHYSAGPDSVLPIYMTDYLESIYEELCNEYDAELPQTTIIEVFPDHRQFAVRIHGKPWIHTVGACTGRVIAMDAPRPEVQGHYNYAGVLRHEFTHTVTLAATDNRIAHWFTEGLAVLQEEPPRQWSWRIMLVDALRHDTLFDISKIDWGFIRPRVAGDRQKAYAQSEWMCEFLIEKFGYKILQDMIRLFREGRTQSEVIHSLTGWTESQFDAAFREWARKDASEWGLSLTPATPRWAINLLTRFYDSSPKVLAHHARALLQQGFPGRALEESERALQQDPANATALLAAAQASYMLAREQPLPQAQKNFLEKSRDYYAQLAKHDPSAAEAFEFLAQWHQSQDESEEAMEWALKLKQLQPQNPASYEILAGYYLRQNQDDLALPELLEWARFDDHDPFVPRQIAQIYRAQGRLRPAAYWYRKSIHIDPYHTDTHLQLGEVLLDLNLGEEAIREFNALTLLQPENARFHAELAFAYHRMGHSSEAQQAATRAVQLDPSSPARQLLP